MDGTQIGVVGLDEILAALYEEGRQANQDTSEEIVNRLEAQNYIPSSELTRREYRRLLLNEYKEYLGARAREGTTDHSDPAKKY